MTRTLPQVRGLPLSLLLGLFMLFPGMLSATDGLIWDGKPYPFKALDPSSPNSEDNPFIIDTAGKLGFLSWLSGRSHDMDFDLEVYGQNNGLKGLRHGFKDNHVKLAKDLDMNGSKFELRSMGCGFLNFDGDGHVIDNFRISDATTPVMIDSQQGTVEMYLGLFQDAETIKNLGIGKRSRIIFKGGSQYTNSVWAGSIAATAYKIDNCHSEATITIQGEGDSLVAGLAAECGYLSNSNFSGTISVDGKVISSQAKNKRGKTIPGELRVGGVSARVDKLLANCHNTGSINVTSSGELVEIGGVSADLNDYVCSNLYNTGSIRLNADGEIKNASIGGVIGYGWTYSLNPRNKTDPYGESGFIYNQGTVDVSILTGGLIGVGGITGGKGETGARFSTGFFEMTGIYGILNAYNSGAVTVSSTGKAQLDVGGIAGCGVMVVNSYNTGMIHGISGPGASLALGGLGGKAVYVQNCYNIGPVSGEGPGTRQVGGIVGNASEVCWGETKTSLNTMQNGFWLRQADGTNSEIPYGKGSYFYMRKGDMKKSDLGSVLDALAPEDPDLMVEDLFGVVYTFDSPTATIMKRSDDATGKRADLEGTLLYHLNEMVEDKVNRAYRRWVLDGSNGGYPVLAAEPTVYQKNHVRPDTTSAQKIAGQYLGTQTKWKDTLMLRPDGTFQRSTGTDGGTWAYDGTRLILKWTKWAPEILKEQAPGEFSSNVYPFTLTRTAPAGSKPETGTTTVTPVTPDTRKHAGIYLAVHKDWTDSLTLKADGSFVRGNGDGGTWTFEKRTLVLDWNNGTRDSLVLSATGFASLSYKFTLRPRP